MCKYLWPLLLFIPTAPPSFTVNLGLPDEASSNILKSAPELPEFFDNPIPHFDVSLIRANFI